ncbi:MAG: acriflavin resistance protein [Acidimicrobiales bacterium]|nr:acriflavin resistance protein [Acidimicrobiales bacterium]
MRWLVRSAIKLRFLVVAVGATLIFLGVGEARRSSVDVFPEFAPPTVEVQTECVGLSPAEVEQVVTTPLEQALSGIAGLDVMRSQSVGQLSSIQLLFKQGTNVLRARELVQEKLAGVRPTLPNWAAPPNIIQPKSATSRILEIGLSSNKMSLIDLSVLAVNKVRARLLRVPGVANVSIWGERMQMLQVEVDPARLHANGVALDQVMEVTSNALDAGVLKYERSTSVGTGGVVITPNQNLQLEHKVPIVSPQQLADSVIEVRNGKPLRIGDVADVVVEHQQLIGDAVINSGPGLMLIVDKFPWGNTLDVTRSVDSALDEMRPGLPGVKIDAEIFRPATFIQDAIGNLTSSIVLGSLLVLFVLALFLFEWRSALISIVTIPVSLMASLLVLRLQHVTVNTMILAGLVIALGAIVDDAIVDIENIVRRLRQHRTEGTGGSTASIILESSLEVRSAVVYASFIEVAALVPIFFLKGLTGSFFRPLATAYALSVLVSLLVALLLTPALAMLLLRGARLERHESPLARGLQRGYGNLLTRVVRRPLPAVLVAVSIVLAGVVVLPRLGESLFPTFKERDFLMHWVTKPGTSAPEEVRIVTRVSEELSKIPGVTSFGSHIGRAIQGDEIVGVNAGENWIAIDRHVDYDTTVAAIERVVAGYPGLFSDVQTYLRERTKEVLTGSSDAIVVRIFGPDLKQLRTKGQEIQRILAKIPGTIDAHVEFQEEVPQVEVQVDLAKAQLYGLKPGDVRRAASTLVAGEEGGTVFKGGKNYDVFVWSKPQVRTSPSSIESLLLDTPAGTQVRLGDVARVQVKPAPNVVRHEGGFRRIDVGTNVQGRDLGAVAADIRTQLAKVGFPQGYHAEVLGEYAERQAATQRLVGFALIAALAVLLLLRVSFHNWRLALLAFVTLPVALVGGELAAFFFNRGTISLGSLVGFFTVLGIVARNGIMMISHYHHLETQEDVAFGPELVVRGAKERLAPILMTGLATGLALVPLVVKGDVPGQEIEFPLAIVILGGLLASALLNLFILPPLYLRFGKSRRRSATGVATT